MTDDESRDVTDKIASARRQGHDEGYQAGVTDTAATEHVCPACGAVTRERMAY